MRSPLFWFLSLALCAAQARAAWRIESRPLEKAPWGRTIPRMVEAHTELSHLEGSGVYLRTGPNEIFDVSLPDGPRRELEFQIAYVRTAPGAPAGKCPVRVEVAGRSITREVPQRSMKPDAEPYAALAGSYDYVAPAWHIPLAPGPQKLHMTVSLTTWCGEGQLFVYDPKIWVERPGAAHRFIMVVADSLSSDWFEGGRDFMPFTRRWFSTFDTRVWSAGSNTHDTTNIVSKMQFRLREPAFASAADDPHVRPVVDDRATGLLPAFLAAGYDAVSFNSNLLLSAVFEPTGFRSFYNLNNSGTPANDRSPEVSVGQLRDWLQRHPDHDVFAFLWFDTTHVHGPAPEVRPGFRAVNLPYADVPRNQDVIAEQARSMSYVDIAIEKLAASPLVEKSDVVFFADHGINFRTLQHAEPLWGSCTAGAVGAANQHLEPVELRIPVGVRLYGQRLEAPKVDSGLLDWIHTAVHRHNPAIDVSKWEGRDLASLTASSPILVAGHGARAAMFRGGRQLLFSSALCGGEGGAIFLSPDGSRAPDAETLAFVREFASRSLLHGYSAVSLHFLDGAGSCKVQVEGPGALDEHGAPLGALTLDSGGWYSERRVFVPELLPDLQLHAEPAGCAVAEVGNVRRPVPASFSLAQSGLMALRDLPPARLAPQQSAILQLGLSRDRFALSPDHAFARTSTSPNSEKTQLSSELRAAMKRWGYIQDDSAE